MTAAELKKMLSPKLLSVDGVSGVSTQGNSLVVFLEDHSDNVKEQVQELVKESISGVAVEFVITGGFRAAAKRRAG